jgi:GNAT superfamily N-acetyltransferase
MTRIAILPINDERSIARVAALAAEIWNEYFTPIIGTAQVEYMLDKFQSTAAIAVQLQDGYAYYLFKDTAGDTVGYMAVQPQGTDLFLSKIYLRRDARGKGYGRQAIEFIEELAAGKKLGRITLTVNRKNAGSIAAYKKMGFTVYDTICRDIGGGFVMDDYGMEKRL